MGSSSTFKSFRLWAILIAYFAAVTIIKTVAMDLLDTRWRWWTIAVLSVAFLVSMVMMRRPRDRTRHD